MAINPKITCSIEGCTKSTFCRTWCSAHYSRWQRHGDPLFQQRSSPLPPGAIEKTCPRCGETKPLDYFKKRSNGVPKGYCFSCENSYQAGYAATDHGNSRRRKAGLKWKNANRDYLLQWRYGITEADYDALLAAQDGRCAVCRTDKPGGSFNVFPVDHCHQTNRVRGLLCSKCNMGIGLFDDDPAALRAAIAYLERQQ